MKHMIKSGVSLKIVKLRFFYGRDSKYALIFKRFLFDTNLHCITFNEISYPFFCNKTFADCDLKVLSVECIKYFIWYLC